MAGIYIHIPFCRKRCNYCDFFKTTQLLRKTELIETLVMELNYRKEELTGEQIETIYFGGGTPSLLTEDEINKVIDTIYKQYNVSESPEITLEANPDDLTQQKLNNLKNTPVNRLSVGIQSFQDTHLQLMNRRHNSNQAINCIKLAQDKGYTNISTDLIYGLPDLTLQLWQQNLEQMAELKIQHLSAYHLTYEEGTVFDTMLKNKALFPITEEESIAQFKYLIEWAASQGFEHYEISNFALPGYYSKHNTSYWQQKKYLGIGPSAHSYDLNTRRWNVSNLEKYLAGVHAKTRYFETEELTLIDTFNEFLMTRLRTRWGVNFSEVKSIFGEVRLAELKKQAEKFISGGSLYLKEDNLILTDEGIFISDSIISDLMILPV